MVSIIQRRITSVHLFFGKSEHRLHQVEKAVSRSVSGPATVFYNTIRDYVSTLVHSLNFMRPAKCIPTFQRPTHLTPTLYCVPRKLSHTHKHSASDKLFADAAREESEGTSQGPSKSQKLNVLEQEHENWTGDENIKDAVLRMLVDKYKPLRGPTIVTAEQKLKQAPPKVWSSSSGVTSTSSGYLKPHSGSWAGVPLLPSSETHKPWETTFKAPTEGGPVNIKTAQMPSPSLQVSANGLSGSGSLDERLVRKEKEKMKKAQQVGRLSQALESTLDYKLGIKHGQMPAGRPNPVSVKGWNSLIEERIEVSFLW